MRVQTTLIGVNALLMHNINLADPDNEWTKRIAQVTSDKRRMKTEEGRKEKSRLEWFGSLYVDAGIIVVPVANVQKCFEEAAKVTRQGKTITRALSAADIYTPLAVTDPDTGRPVDPDPETLWSDGRFRDTTLVGVNRSRVTRTRPKFPRWALTVEWELVDQLMDYDEFDTIVHLAGKIEGLGDNRRNGWGRFAAEVDKL